MINSNTLLHFKSDIESNAGAHIFTINNAHVAYDSFIAKFLASYYDIPNQDNKAVSYPYKLWLTKSLIHCINRKNYLYSKFCKRLHLQMNIFTIIIKTKSYVF